jgi:hypothetical protein
MADQTDISQFITETAADTGSAQISQDIAEVGASSSSAQISQDIVEVGGDASAAQISQLQVETGASKSAAIISQLTIELGRGPEVIPPTDTPLGTFTVGFGGLNINWYLIPNLANDGIELRDKLVKAVRVTGKVSNANIKVYAYQPTQNIDIDELENGTNAAVTVFLADTTQVVQSQRWQVNVPNAMQETVRVAGFWTGTGSPDRVDEIVWERSGFGVRR